MAQGPYVMGIDFGTGGVRAGVFDAEGARTASTRSSSRPITRARAGPSRTPTNGGRRSSAPCTG